MRKIFALIGFALAISLTSVAEANWHVATSEHFIIYSEEEPASLRTYAEKLERFDRVLRLTQRLPLDTPVPAAARVTIFALANEKAITTATGMGGIAGLYVSNAAGAVALTARGFTDKEEPLSAQIVLLHEYAHHFMLTNLPASYPAWYIEGYAEFVSTAEFADNGDVGLGLPAMHRGIDLNFISEVPVSTMMAGGYWTSAVLEAKGWLLTHYLTFAPERKGQLAAYLTAINKGADPSRAARDIFGNLGSLDEELSRYTRRKSFPYLSVDAKKIAPGSITIGDVPPGESALLMVRMNTRLGVDDREARQRVAEARKLAAPFPDDPSVLCTLAEAESNAKQTDRADLVATHLLAVQPESVCGLIFKGKSAQARAAAAKAPSGDKAWADARSWFVRANRADPENALPMALYYRSFRDAHETPSPNAVTALLGAVQRAPQDGALRYLAVMELLRAKRVDDASIEFAPLVGPAHGQTFVMEALRALQGRIGRDDPAALAEEMEARPAKFGMAF